MPRVIKNRHKGGRPKGSTNKKDAIARADLKAILLSRGHNSAAELVEALQYAKADYLATRVDAKGNERTRGSTTALEVWIKNELQFLEFQFPRMKQIDFAGGAGESFKSLTDLFKALVDNVKSE